MLQFIRDNWVWFVLGIIVLLTIVLLIVVLSNKDKSNEEKTKNFEVNSANTDIKPEDKNQPKDKRIRKAVKKNHEPKSDEQENTSEKVANDAEPTKNLDYVKTKEQKENKVKNKKAEVKEVAEPEKAKEIKTEKAKVVKNEKAQPKEVKDEKVEKSVVKKDEPKQESIKKSEKKTGKSKEQGKSKSAEKSDVKNTKEQEKSSEVENNKAPINASDKTKDEAIVEKSAEKATERYRVVYDKENKNWIVRVDGGKRASRRCATKEEALKVAKDLAKKKDADLSVHKKNGKFQKQK